MKTTDKEIDKIIHEALSNEEAAYYDQLGEQSVIDMAFGVFQGKNKGIYILTFIMSFILFGVVIWAGFQFYYAETLKEMLTYGALGFWCMIGVMGVKIWYWMQMNTNALMREMKRLELQLAIALNEREK